MELNLNFSNLQLNPKTTRFVVISNILVLLWSIVCALTGAGWVWISVLAYGFTAAFVVYAIIEKDMILVRLMLFGLLAGLLELFADHWAVTGSKTLVYPNDEPMLWTSPLYMPFSWIIVFAQLGWYSLMLVRWKGIWVSMIVIAIAGGMYIPLYEHLAQAANWWYYQDCPMILGAPYYVIFAELLLSLTVPPLILWSAKNKLGLVVLFAAVEGVWIYFAGLIAFHFFG